MNKQIRPLAAYKKQNPRLCKTGFEFAEIIGESSAKGKENAWYWFHGFSEITRQFNESEKLALQTDFKNNFFWRTENKCNNVATVSEMGRLLLTGWYYNIDDWTKEICKYVYRAYQKKTERGDQFNDLEFKEAVKKIRENIGYYYHNKDELKLFILKAFFNEDLQKMLPPKPDKLKHIEDTLNWLTTMRENQAKKGVNHWIKQAEDYEGYAYYLQEILEEMRICGYQSFDDWKTERENEAAGYLKPFVDLENEYNEQVRGQQIPDKILSK